jgi:hypothetical protein
MIRAEGIAKLQERFWSKVEKTDGCWLWRGALNSEGYGNFWDSGKHRGAHRIAWELSHGEIPDGMQIDHICRKRSCVRPDHLRLASNKQNKENQDCRGQANNTSGARGVYWRADRHKWAVQVKHNGMDRHGGLLRDFR